MRNNKEQWLDLYKAPEEKPLPDSVSLEDIGIIEVIRFEIPAEAWKEVANQGPLYCVTCNKELAKDENVFGYLGKLYCEGCGLPEHWQGAD